MDTTDISVFSRFSSDEDPFELQEEDEEGEDLMETGGVREKEIFTVTAITLTHRSQHFSIPYMYHII